MYNFDPYNVLLAIATNIPQRLMTAFVLQAHIYLKFLKHIQALLVFFYLRKSSILKSLSARLRLTVSSTLSIWLKRMAGGSRVSARA